MIIKGRKFVVPYAHGTYNAESDTYTIRIDCEKFPESWVEIIVNSDELKTMLARKLFVGTCVIQETGYVPLLFHEETKT